MNRHTSTWSRESSTCKFWLEPIELARSHGFSARELNVVRRAQPAHAVVNRLRKRSGDRTPEGDGGGRSWSRAHSMAAPKGLRRYRRNRTIA